MEESVTYQAILEEGYVEGYRQGIEQALEELLEEKREIVREMIITLARPRLGYPDWSSRSELQTTCAVELSNC